MISPEGHRQKKVWNSRGVRRCFDNDKTAWNLPTQSNCQGLVGPKIDTFFPQSTIFVAQQL